MSTYNVHRILRTSANKKQDILKQLISIYILILKNTNKMLLFFDNSDVPLNLLKLALYLFNETNILCRALLGLLLFISCIFISLILHLVLFIFRGSFKELNHFSTTNLIVLSKKCSNFLITIKTALSTYYQKSVFQLNIASTNSLYFKVDKKLFLTFLQTDKLTSVNMRFTFRAPPIL